MNRSFTTLTVALATLVASACGGSSLPATTTSSTTAAADSSTTTTEPQGRISLTPNDDPLILEGTKGPLVEALQFYLVCTGHEEPTPGRQVTVDGSFGPITADAVAYYQAELRRVPTGEPDEATFAALARDCAATRAITFPEGVFTLELGGNTAPGDEEEFTFAAAGGQVLVLDAVEGAVAITVIDASGVEVAGSGDGTAVSAELDSAQTYTVRVSAPASTTYRIEARVRSPNVVATDFGPMKLEGDGIVIADFGDDPVNTVAVIALLLGSPHDDTGWLDTEEGCTGSNRHVTWLIQGDPDGADHPAAFIVDFTSTGGSPYFSQYTFLSLDLPALDPLARGLATAEGITLGSTYDEFVEAYQEPTFFDPTRGLTREGDLVVGFSLVGDPAAPDGAASRIRYLGAGEDGCEDFG